MNLNWRSACLIAAFVCFVLAVCGLRQGQLTAAGLALLTASFL